MSPYDNRSTVDETARGEAGSFFQFDVSDMVGIVRRGWFYIVLGTLIGIGSSLAALSAMSPLYKAEARIVFIETNAEGEERVSAIGRAPSISCCPPFKRERGKGYVFYLQTRGSVSGRSSSLS